MFRVEVLVEEPGVVQPGGHDAQGLGQLLADRDRRGSGQSGSCSLDELVERNRVGDPGVTR